MVEILKVAKQFWCVDSKYYRLRRGPHLAFLSSDRIYYAIFRIAEDALNRLND